MPSTIRGGVREILYTIIQKYKEKQEERKALLMQKINCLVTVTKFIENLDVHVDKSVLENVKQLKEVEETELACQTQTKYLEEVSSMTDAFFVTMVKSCCITSCNVSGDGVDYFKLIHENVKKSRFPVSKSLRAAWLSACGGPGEAVCAAHFADRDYRSARGARRLRATAVPSLKLPKNPSSITENETKEPTETTLQIPTKTLTETTIQTPSKTPTKSKKKGGKKKNKKTSVEKQTDKTNVEETVNKEKVNTTEKTNVEETVDKAKVNTTEKTNVEETVNKGKVNTTEKRNLEETVDKAKVNTTEKTNVEETVNKEKVNTTEKRNLEETVDKEKVNTTEKTNVEETVNKGKVNTTEKTNVEETVNKEKVNTTEKRNLEETVDKEKVKTTEEPNLKETVNKEKVNTTEKEDVEKEKLKTIENKEPDKSQGAMCVKENGKVNSAGESIRMEENDIEEMITNYQIQTKSLDPEPLEDLIPSILADHIRDVSKHKDVVPSKPNGDTTGDQLDSATMTRIANRLADQLDVQLNYPMPGVMGMNPMSDVFELDRAPVFIEVPVEENGGSRCASPEDCLMVLESVQCDVDPGSLMPPDSGSDMEILDVPDGKPSTRKRKAEAISLLTSSDEDEVIFQEPKIDTVEVSDDTDEDDRPLLTLITKPKPKPIPKPIPKPKRKSVFGMYQYYCEQCTYKTDDESHFKKHNLDLDHSTPLQICTFCSYTTASRVQFARHKRKHRDERNYKCHFCNYKARHNMSLMYHLKSHTPPSGRMPKFTCVKCGFYSDVKAEGLNHIKTCRDGRFLCDSCDYSTKRKSDLKRHMTRRHHSDDDEDFTL